MNDRPYLFVSVPISSFSDTDSSHAFEQFITHVLRRLRLRLPLWHIYCAAEAVRKRGGFETPEIATKDDLAALYQATHFLLFYPVRVPTSALIELGIAVARDIPIVTVSANRSTLPFMAQAFDKTLRSFSMLELDFSDNATHASIVERVALKLLASGDA